MLKGVYPRYPLGIKTTMVVAGDFRNGITFDMDGQVMQVIEFQHVKPGKGAASVRYKAQKRYHRRGC